MWMYFCFAIKISKLEHGKEKAPQGKSSFCFWNVRFLFSEHVECQNTFVSIFRWGTP
jgi:hypothetical protein